MTDESAGSGRRHEMLTWLRPLRPLLAVALVAGGAALVRHAYTMTGSESGLSTRLVFVGIGVPVVCLGLTAFEVPRVQSIGFHGFFLSVIVGFSLMTASAFVDPRGFLAWTDDESFLFLPGRLGGYAFGIVGVAAVVGAIDAYRDWKARPRD